jgi:hypothetical protein
MKWKIEYNKDLDKEIVKLKKDNTTKSEENLFHFIATLIQEAGSVLQLR